VQYRNAMAGVDFPAVRVGDPLAFFLRMPVLVNAVDAAVAGNAARSVELHQVGGTETWHKVTISPLGLGDVPERFVIVLQNLTEQKRVESLRSDFIANASHELRTPLASLVGFIDTLLGPAARDETARERFLTIMRGQAQRMSKLIDDLLSLSRIEMRQHMLPSGSVDLGGLLAEVAEGLQPLAKRSEVVLSLKPPERAVAVTGARDELYEVFENLIENAISYGGDGGRVDIAVGPVKNQPGFDIAVTVTDYGAGIAPEHVPRLTERFYRVDAGVSRKKKGTGLGLAIVKHILQRHRGKLVIRSIKGEGTTAEVLLPERKA
jgi:two-component system phosphate regulon sensor histidine kinase PhoR